MELREAFDLVVKLTAEVKATRQDHLVISAALNMIQAKLFPPPEQPTEE